jgi:inner membrane transporter RhtA
MVPSSKPVIETGSTTRTVGLVLVAVSSVQVGAALAKHLFPILGSAGTVAVRMVTAALLLVALARPRLRGIRRSQLSLIGAFALVLVVMNLSFYAALERIPLGVAVTVEFAGPLAVAVLGSRRPRDLLWVGMAALGVVVLTGGGTAFTDGSLDLLGVGFALTAATCWAGYIVLSQRVGAVLPSLHGLALAIGVAAVVVIPIGIASAGRELLRPDLLAMGAAVGLLSSAVPWGLEFVALRSLSSATFGVLMSTEPAVAALAGYLLLHEELSALQVTGMALICVASAGAALQGPTGQAEPIP